MNRMWWTVLIMLVFLVGTFGAVARSAKTPPKSVTLASKIGDVTFLHEKHSEELKISCSECHHMMHKEKDKMACKDCHKTTTDGSLSALKEVFHKTCKSCHDQKVKESGSRRIPTRCNACHKS